MSTGLDPQEEEKLTQYFKTRDCSGLPEFSRLKPDPTNQILGNEIIEAGQAVEASITTPTLSWFNAFKYYAALMLSDMLPSQLYQYIAPKYEEQITNNFEALLQLIKTNFKEASNEHRSQNPAGSKAIKKNLNFQKFYENTPLYQFLFQSIGLINYLQFFMEEQGFDAVAISHKIIPIFEEILQQLKKNDLQDTPIYELIYFYILVQHFYIAAGIIHSADPFSNLTPVQIIQHEQARSRILLCAQYLDYYKRLNKNYDPKYKLRVKTIRQYEALLIQSDYKLQNFKLARTRLNKLYGVIKNDSFVEYPFTSLVIGYMCQLDRVQREDPKLYFESRYWTNLVLDLIKKKGLICLQNDSATDTDAAKETLAKYKKINELSNRKIKEYIANRVEEIGDDMKYCPQTDVLTLQFEPSLPRKLVHALKHKFKTKKFLQFHLNCITHTALSTLSFKKLENFFTNTLPSIRKLIANECIKIEKQTKKSETAQKPNVHSLMTQFEHCHLNESSSTELLESSPSRKPKKWHQASQETKKTVPTSQKSIILPKSFEENEAYKDLNFVKLINTTGIYIGFTPQFKLTNSQDENACKKFRESICNHPTRVGAKNQAGFKFVRSHKYVAKLIGKIPNKPYRLLPIAKDKNTDGETFYVFGNIRNTKKGKKRNHYLP